MQYILKLAIMALALAISSAVLNTAQAALLLACPPYPAFPNAACTGWRHTGVTLKAVPAQITSGPGWHWEGPPFNYIKVTGAVTVLTGLDIKGCIFVDAGIQTLRINRSRITGNCPYLIRFYDKSPYIILVDVELVGSAVQVKHTKIRWVRVNAHSFTGKSAMMGSNSYVSDSYIHDPVCHLPDHQSGIGTNGGATGVYIHHNHVDIKPSGCVSGGIANYDDFGAFHTVTIDSNLINSGGYCLKAGFEDNNAKGNTGMKVVNNFFGRKYYPNCGLFGVVSNWIRGFGNVWSHNFWADTRQPIPEP